MKLPSAWVFPTGSGYVDTASMTAPSALAVSEKTATTAKLSWTNGEAGEPIEILIVTGGVPGSWGDDDRVAMLPAGSVEFVLRGLNYNAQHTAAVRHRVLTILKLNVRQMMLAIQMKATLRLLIRFQGIRKSL